MNDKIAPLLTLSSPWSENENPIWIASAIALNRNIDKFSYPHKLAGKKKREILNAISEELLKEKAFQQPMLISAEEMTPIEKEFLYEHFLTPQSFHQAHSGEGFLVDNSGSYLVSINLEDHLQIRSINCKGEMEKSWNDLMEIEMRLGNKVSYSYSSRFGFLTANSGQCGTALSVVNFLQTPALIHAGGLKDFMESHQDSGISITGLQGTPEETIGDLLAISNHFTLGLSEETIISSIRSFTTKLLVMEKSTRTKIREANSSFSELKDLISRAFGLLIHSYQIEAIEAMNEISLLKLGLDLGWLKDVTVKELNSLFFNCRRAHLVRHFQQHITKEELPHKRAEFIHKTLKKAKLTI